jgi:hypothetical protein
VGLNSLILHYFAFLNNKNNIQHSVQKQLNCALRVVLNVKLVDKISIVKLHEETKKLTFNQLAIESMRKLVLTIMNNESRGLKDFFEANVPPQEKCLRSTSQGKLNAPLRKQTGQSFREPETRNTRPPVSNLIM